MWSGNRRKRDLLISAVSIICLNLLIYLDIRPPIFESNYNQKNGYFECTDQSLQQSLLIGIEALKYMYASQLGKAKVEELVEKMPNNTEKIRHCSGRYKIKKTTNRKWAMNGDLHIFSAYLDRRPTKLLQGHSPIVRIISSAFGTIPLNQTYFCHVRFYADEEGEYTENVVKATVQWIWQRAWDPRNEFYNAFLISCPLAESAMMPGSVLVSRNNFCISSNDVTANFIEISDMRKDLITETSNLNLSPNQIKVAVCVKGLAFLDETELSVRWIKEWLELQWTLGASSVGVFVYRVPDKMRKVLEEMATRGKVELRDLGLPGNSPNNPLIRHQYILRNRQQKRRHELIPYNDCFYRFSSTHHFVLIVDTDEVVAPIRRQNWQAMLAEVLKGQWRNEPTSISIRNVFKFWSNQSEVDSPFESQLRSGIVQERDQYGKSFISTRSVTTVFNHFALHRLFGNASKTFFVDENDAVKLHWKERCPSFELGKELCNKIENNLIEDKLLLRYKNQVIKN